MTRSQKKPASAGSSRSTLRSKTVPSLFAKQKSTASKRRVQQEEVSSDEEQDDELDSSDSSGSDYDSDVGTKKSSRKRQKTKEKTRRGKGATNITVSTSSQLLEPISQSQPEQQESLYDKIVDATCNVEELVSQWIERYNEDRETSLRELVNFVLRCSGCSMAITAVAFNEEDGSVEALQELQQELVKLFFAELIDQTQHEAIYDGMLIETLQNWLTTMSSSTYRPFRHTATVVALKLISALCIVGENTKDESVVATRQLNAEQKKGGNSRNTQKLRLLKQKCTTVERKLKDIQEFLGDFFNSIFVHRSRDVESVIRTECIKELCHWMCTFKSFFVDNAYLRFLGWAFNDQNANVRSEAVKSMASLYRIEDIANKLSAFTNRFKSRIEEMALYDVDINVRVHTIHLCSTLFKSNVQILSEEGQMKLSSMIASNIPRVRKSVAPFVKAIMETNFITPLKNEVSGAASKTRGRGRKTNTTTAPTVNINQTWVVFKSFAAFLVQQSTSILEQETNNESGTDNMQVDLSSLTNALIEKRSTIITDVVETLWGHISELQDYQAMCDYLIRDHSRSLGQQTDDQMDVGEIEECYRLSEEEEVVLVNALVACLNTAVERGLDKNLTEVKDKKHPDKSILEENKKEISRYLVEAFPKLLSRHTDDASKMTQLVSVPTLMDLNAYVELRAEGEYEKLIQTLVNVYQNAMLKDLVVNCAESLQHLSKATYLSEVNDPRLASLREVVVGQVREVCSGKDLVTTRYSTALIHSISVNMLRLAHLISFTDPTTIMDDAQGMSMNVLDYVGALVDRAAFGYEKEKNIAQFAMVVLSRYIMWKCNSLSYSSEAAALIERRRDWVIDKFTELVVAADVSPLPEIRASAFGYLVDIYWLFSSDLFDSHNLARLKTKCPATLQQSCAQYVENQINSLKALEDENSKLKETEKTAQKDIILQIITSFSRGILMNVFDISYATTLLEQYGSSYSAEADEIIKALVTEYEADLITGEVAADGICRSYMEALKRSFTKNVNDSWRSIDKTLKLARLEAGSLRKADQVDVARKVPPHVVCERIHLDGISFALAKAREAYDNNKDDEKDNALKFFKILAVFGKDLARARDIAKIRNHLEDCLKDNGLTVEENKKEWEHYINYIKTIDDVLKKKGLRYDSTKRANNAETPAAHAFDDIMEDLGDLGDLSGNVNKRPLGETEMDIDEEGTTKRSRNL
ncbi:hypothetical protein RO3G_04056 [Rhizopus delemar RA 99-880]|uniref:SCD domain-containing protein n=1 Tax=Rhizopus delemar (strain RA 99-880 / ATCC MYA-4621 / FGSC 9543 / NRRL 43880) TaxID=246409 RepID=I1BT21_RHIO9|nr:hypothetical protein RO3G_04056 [Rhizopus delemar RA 99-880]|eukprot:EIE79351.1 hypothetical protein RO3G_04056 [Rhizopus delemar RA 99-880]